jgi:thymidylate kinase
MKNKQIVVGIVGPCKSGKSNLKKGLEEHGYHANHIAQEHSYSPQMWQKIVAPDILIYLDVSYEKTLERSGMKWTYEEYQKQQNRLAHARKYANFYISTDELSEQEVIQLSLCFLETSNISN